MLETNNGEEKDIFIFALEQMTDLVSGWSWWKILILCAVITLIVRFNLIISELLNFLSEKRKNDQKHERMLKRLENQLSHSKKKKKK